MAAIFVAIASAAAAVGLGLSRRGRALPAGIAYATSVAAVAVGTIAAGVAVPLIALGLIAMLHASALRRRSRATELAIVAFGWAAVLIGFAFTGAFDP